MSAPTHHAHLTSSPAVVTQVGPGAQPAYGQIPKRTPGWGAFVAAARRPLAFYVVSRLLVLGAVYIATLISSGWTVLRFLSAGDSVWYRSVMVHGYDSVVPEIAGRATQTNLVFFPIYPLVARPVSWILPGSDAVAMLVATFLFGAAAVVLLTLLARELTDERTAARAGILFCFFPGSLALSMGYAEALCLALSIACLWALLRSQWLLAGLAAALATATRPNAIVLVLVCLWQAGVAIRERREWKALLAPVLAPAGILGFFGYLWWRTGEMGVWFRVENEAWQTSVGKGAGLNRLGQFFVGPLTNREITLIGLSFIVAAALTWLLVRRRGWPGVLTVYTLAVLAMSATSRNDFIRPRDILMAFPVFLALAEVTRRRAFGLTVGSFAAGLAALTVFHTFPGVGAP